MLRHTTILLAGSLLLPSVLFCQSSGKESLEEAAINLKTSAAQMLIAYRSRDFEKSADFMHPKAVELYFGTKTRLIEVLKVAVKKMDSANYKIIKTSIDKISEIVAVGTELQAIVTQSVTMRVPGGMMIAITSLLAVSEDNGKTWYFTSTAKRTREDLKKIVPQLSPDIPIPEAIEPTFMAD